MSVKINRWHEINHQGDGIASFNFTISDIRIRGALFKRRGDGYAVTMPFLRMRDADGKGITAVGLPYSLMQEVLNAAIEYYETRGVRRVIGADIEESMQMAGL